VTGPVVRHGSRGPIIAALTLAAALAWSCATPGDQVASGVRFPKPDRPVAAIVSPEYSNEQTRDRHQEAERVMDRLGIRPGMRVADIGAGLGYYTVRLARRLGPSAAIYAQDVSAEYLGQLRARLERDRVRGVTLVLGTPGDPRLPPASIDVAILSHMYHEVVNPFEFLYRLHSSLAPGARVAIIDLDKRTPDHGTPPALLRCELAAVGYRQVDFTVLAPADGYLAVFAPPAVLPPVESIKPCKQ
jgi:ubiquinone/menaquinone biosynthesis C-methylase UbiE